PTAGNRCSKAAISEALMGSSTGRTTSSPSSRSCGTLDKRFTPFRLRQEAIGEIMGMSGRIFEEAELTQPLRIPANQVVIVAPPLRQIPRQRDACNRLGKLVRCEVRGDHHHRL